ncbi:peptidoglycan DD-metalloendopeptidase family protein [Aestuariicella hydrocarbonica]|uniref:Peptidoglycan DD-metalloendopeptidase family protein n=1 Tax=Pseudomaricurvus hydrocarbonicus TaxID=1470433 RepID=A0A9E5MNM1_9GAMM|nr:peptidoglycan DD-metalloendopeptidase family protein [Aestuariicella hydrocarbonica]NHO67565.1 peptidoglycan DD-metalloendopeptidase family protein [Aestuariicella hydrocarbonica]
MLRFPLFPRAFFPRALLVSAALLFASHGFAQTQDEDYQAKLQELQKAIGELKSELNQVKSTRDQLQNDLQTSEVDIGALVNKIDRLKGELASQKKQLAQLNLKQAELQVARHEQQKHIAQHINAAYRLGKQSHIKLLLNQEEPDSLARMAKYYEYFLDARADKIDTYLDTIAELDAIKPEIESRTRTLEDSQRQLQQRHQQLSSKQHERQQTLARLSQSIQRKDQQLQQMAQNKQRLEKLLAEVSAAIANLQLPGDGQPFQKRRGKMAMPAQGKLLKTFGSTKLAGKLKWEGVLIGAKAGTDVKAIHHGRVVFADYLRGQGLLVIVDHGDGYMSLYAHNQALLTETGDWINSGETIARVGNTGGQQQVGLYFEVRHNGKPTNPAHWCRS